MTTAVTTARISAALNIWFNKVTICSDLSFRLPGASRLLQVQRRETLRWERTPLDSGVLRISPAPRQISTQEFTRLVRTFEEGLSALAIALPPEQVKRAAAVVIFR